VSARTWHGVGLCVLGVSLAALEARAEAVVYQFRTQEDPDSPPDPKVCAAAPFAVNVQLGASVYIPTRRGADDKGGAPGEHREGTATACLQLTDRRFPPGQQVPFYARFDLRQGRFTVLGTCTLVSNDVPEAGIVLAGCALRLVGMPPGFVGGTMSSTSVFNPSRRPGYATGSYYTLYGFTEGASGAPDASP
jgi:hypothetical protein